MKDELVLVTGATGYIGGRLVPKLLEAGYRVRVMARDITRLQGRTWMQQVELAEGDVLNPEALSTALSGVTVAYYLVHSMTSGKNYDQRDLQAARYFGSAARNNGVSRIIYLGGLGDPQSDLSSHLRSRQLTGQALQESGVPVTEFRAAIVVGSGSISFEMIRYLTERLPVMICPRWVFNRVQPIAIGDVLEYLVAALDTPESTGRVLEIGGSEISTYGEIMLAYAQARGLRRKLLPVPVLTPRLSSYWMHLVTPIQASVARPLIEGLRNEVVVQDASARQLFPHIHPVDLSTAVELALAELEARHVETSWRDALVNSQGDIKPMILTNQKGMYIFARQQIVPAQPAAVFKIVTRMGGKNGWYYMNWSWRLRGWMDRMVGGVGLRRGRRDPEEIRVGDAVDFWRVEAVEAERKLRFRSELVAPGVGWLQYDTYPHGVGQTRLLQTAYFAPKGLPGLAYWVLMYPAHAILFRGLIHNIANRAVALGTMPDSNSQNEKKDD